MVDRIPPHDIDSEEALLGSLLIDSVAIRKVINELRPFDFYSERNRFIYESCLDLYKRHEVINQITVAQDLASKESLENCGGAAYLSHVISVCPTSLDVEYYAQIVYRLSVYRQMISMSDRISDIGFRASPEQNQSVAQVDELWNNFKKANTTLGNNVITPIKAANDIFMLWSNNKEPVKAPSWGFIDLDYITAGIYPEYVILAARTSMGKTQLALDIAESLVAQGKVVLYASAEMTDIQIYERKLSRLIGMSVLDIRKQGFSEEHEAKILQLVGEVSESKINYLAGKLYLNDVYRQINNILSKGQLDCVFIDYIGALQDCYEGGKDNANAKMSRISNQIQSMVHDFKVPIIALSQLNRELEHRADQHPQLSDLRDSGSLEQDADVIFLGHRDKEDGGVLSNILELTMAKNRQIGARPPIKLIYNEKFRRYTDLSYIYEENQSQSEFNS
jgi:replicative DNA helicase